METSWTLISSAAAGCGDAREDFARRYLPVVKAYLGARWRQTPFAAELDDATQEVFIHCLNDGGALERAEAGRGAGFQAFLFGIVRRVALKFEARSARRHNRRKDGSFHPDQLAVDAESLSGIFDRAWARAVVKEAGVAYSARARAEGGAAERRADLLRIRFEEGKPIREIAALWNKDAAHVHHEYARARNEFRVALRGVVALHQRCGGDKLDRECARVLELLRR